MSEKAIPFPPLRSRKLWNQIQRAYGLTERERETAELLCRGASNEQIGATLGVGETTVRTHCRAVYAKLQCEQDDRGKRLELVLRVVHWSPSDDGAPHL